MGTNAFAPTGQTVFVGASATQIAPNQSVAVQGYRIRNLSSAVQYFTHGSTSSVASLGAPTAGTPSANTIGMLPNSVETFSGLNPFMIASSATGFEVTPGDGV